MELNNLIDYVNIWKMSEAANLVFQWIFVLNSVKHKFFSVSIVKAAIGKHFFRYFKKNLGTLLQMWNLRYVDVRIKAESCKLCL